MHVRPAVPFDRKRNYFRLGELDDVDELIIIISRVHYLTSVDYLLLGCIMYIKNKNPYKLAEHACNYSKS